MAATTFAADTPLAITGLIASKGLSGNWLWLPVLGVHAAMFTFFAAPWSRSGVLTDAEFIALRYSGGAAVWLRWCRAILQLLTNCVILGWVLKGMVKIATPFFRWEEWFPGFVRYLEPFWPAASALGSLSDGLTIIGLLLIVGCYSSLGGLHGVILTDLLQLALALLGSSWLAMRAWNAVGGQEGLLTGLATHYGANHHYLDLLPTPGQGWLGALDIGAFTFGLYLVVQSYAYMSADGGGYFMQRLNATRSTTEAQKASMLFLVIHYMLRIWPWFIVGLVALVLVPVGQEHIALQGAGALARADREMAWPLLMAYLLPPGWLGVVLVSLLAAFMSTVDTHVNWGASYIVNDIWLVLRPQATDREQIRIARLSVLLFIVLAVVVSAQINTIAQAWQWFATMGAALGLPTLLRWLWWRVNAVGELTAMLAGLVIGCLVTLATDMPYEVRLLWVAAGSAVGLLAGIIWGTPTEANQLQRFIAQVQPAGWWPAMVSPHGSAQQVFGHALLSWLYLVLGTCVLLLAGYQWFFTRQPILACGAALVALWLLWWGVHRSLRERHR